MKTPSFLNRSSTLTLALTLALALTLPCLAGPAQAEEPSVLALVRLLVGFPDAGGKTAALVLPGTVIPLDGAPSFEKVSTQGDLETAKLVDLTAALKRAVRLESVETRYSMSQRFPLNTSVELPGPSGTSSLSVSATLTGVTDDLASFKVQFRDGDDILTDSPVAIPRGKRAIIGGLDGKQAPYLFLILEPQKAKEEAVFVGDGFTPPRAIEKVPPQYTEEARKARTTGTVIVQAIIGRQGKVTDLRVLQGLENGLTEAAASAIRQWTFEPALNPDGKPVTVIYNLTINFTLDELEKKPGRVPV